MEKTTYSSLLYLSKSGKGHRRSSARTPASGAITIIRSKRWCPIGCSIGCSRSDPIKRRRESGRRHTSPAAQVALNRAQAGGRSPRKWQPGRQFGQHDDQKHSDEAAPSTDELLGNTLGGGSSARGSLICAKHLFVSASVWNELEPSRGERDGRVDLARPIAVGDLAG